MAVEYAFPQGKPEHASCKVLRDWWDGLTLSRGDRAALRRAATLTEVMLSPSFHRLLHALRRSSTAIPESRYPKLAAIAGLAAQLKGEGGTLGNRMGYSGGGTGAKAPVSELRMRRLLACDDIEELYTLLRRILALLDDRVDLADLAATVWNWCRMDENRSFDPRRRLALDYYASAPLKP